MKHKILVTSRIVETMEYTELRDAISHDLIDYCYNQKALPIIAPNKVELIDSYMNDIELLVLSGGNDVSAISVNNSSNHQLSLLRDKVENNLIRASIDRKIPILGICRGMQLLNLYFGGTIKKIKTTLEHKASEHEIIFEDSIFPYFGIKDTITVNSYHDFGVDKLGKQLVTVARSPDSEIEAFRHRDLPIYGLMWHPERECSSKRTSEFNHNLFRNILEKNS